MMHKMLLLSALLFLCFPALQAQRQETLFGNNRLESTGFWYSRTNNFSFYEEDSEYFSGWNFGFEFNKSFMVGWAWQRLSGLGRIEDTGNPYDLRTNGLLLAYAPKSHKLLHPYLSIVGGSGKLDYLQRQDRVYMVQPALGFELNVVRWLRVGGEAGYRLLSGVDIADIDAVDISSPFAQLQFRFGYSSRW